jgi:hypothetical protein
MPKNCERSTSCPSALSREHASEGDGARDLNNFHGPSCWHADAARKREREIEIESERARARERESERARERESDRAREREQERL